MKSIYDFVRKQRDDYRSKTITVTEGYEFSQYETLRTIELYHNSKFLSGNTDNLGREKPFFNICKFRVNVAVRATDLDTKDVQIQSDRITKTSYAESFLLNLKNRNWMKKTRQGVFLNRFGHTRAKYGGVMVKKTETDGELGIHVVPWLDLITDQIDIRGGIKIERHYYTPAELKTDTPKGWKNIDDAIKTAQKSREAHASDFGRKNDTPGGYVEVWEVHGVLPTCFLRGTSDKYDDNYGSDDEYERQMHVIVLDESTDKEATKGVTLYGGIEDEDPYKYLPYEEVPGRGLGVGVIEDLFEAQVWTNYTEKQKKDMLDLAGKVIFQTSDQNIAAKNVLTDLENGSIVTTTTGELTLVNNSPLSFNALEKVLADWNTQAERVSSTPPAITGETMPAGQPFRLGAMLNAEAGSLFEYRREEAGLFIQEIYLDWVLPFIVKQIKKDKDLTATLEPEELEIVSDAVANAEADKFAKDRILAGQSVTPDEVEAVRGAVRDASMQLRRRSFKGFEKLFDGWEGHVDVVTTGEQRNKTAMLETLFNIFKTVAQAPQLLQDPVLGRLFNQLVEMAGVSPLLLQPSASQSRPAQPTPQPNAPAPLPDKVSAAV